MADLQSSIIIIIMVKALFKLYLDNFINSVFLFQFILSQMIK